MAESATINNSNIIITQVTTTGIEMQRGSRSPIWRSARAHFQA
jgi:hypothetical protein